LPKEISRFVAHLFDKGVSTAHPSSVPTPFNSDNPPPLVRIIDFFKSISDPCSYESVLFTHQDLCPARPVDAEVFDSSHDGDQGSPPSEPTAPNLIGSGMAAQVRPYTADQLTTAAPLGSGPPKKKRLVLASKRKHSAPFDQVITELFLHHAPCSPPDLVEVKLVFGHLFEALQYPAQDAQIDTSVGADTQPAKRLRAVPMRKMLVTSYIIVLTYALLLVTFSKFS
jgi:hypothetical protein